MDEHQLRKEVETFRGDEKRLAEVMIAHALRQKEVSVERIVKFEASAQLIKDGEKAELKELLEDAADINVIKTATGQNLLMFALGSRASLDILELLISSGIDVNAVDDNGSTAAHLILIWGFADYVPKIESLKRHGANLGIADKNGLSVENMVLR